MPSTSPHSSHTERGGGKGRKGASVCYSEGTMADKREDLGVSIQVHFIFWRAGGCPVGNPGLTLASILIPTHRYPLFTITLSSDTLCASLFAWKDLPFTYPPTPTSWKSSLLPDPLVDQMSSLCCHNILTHTLLTQSLSHSADMVGPLVFIPHLWNWNNISPIILTWSL